MKLYEIIVTYPNSTEIYKDYRFFKTLKECREYVESYGMEIVRIKKVDEKNISDFIIRDAKLELKTFYGVHCDYSRIPVKRKIVEFTSNDIPYDETTDYYSVTWFSSHEDALCFLHELEKR